MKKIFTLFFLTGIVLLFVSCSNDKGTPVTTVEEHVVEEKIEEQVSIINEDKKEDEMVEKEIIEEPEEETIKMISLSDFPKANVVESIKEKELNEFDTEVVTAEVFFETGDKIRSSILTNEGALFFGNESCEFYAVDINSKQELWKYITDEPVQSLPIFSNNMVIFNAGNTLYGLSSEKGEEVFKVTHTTGAKGRLSNNEYTYNEASAVVSEGIAFYNALNGDLIAVDITLGEIIWTIPAVYEGTTGSGVNVYNGKLYWVNAGGALCCADINTQEMLFMLNLEDRIYAPMYINDGKIYIAGRNCRLYCIDAENGNLIWGSYADDKTTWFSGGSVCVGDIVYTGTSDRRAVFSFNKDTGEFNRIYKAEANVYTQPVLNGDNLIVTATDVYTFKRSIIMEFDTQNNVKLWRANVTDAIFSSPAVYDGAVYFGTDSGKVYYINLN